MLETLSNIFHLIFSESFILTVVTASTPLLLASSGELVVERSGVLNLGVEGMMIVGAACGFAGAYLSDSIAVGALCGIAAGVAVSMIFGILTLGLAVNQVATGLALTIFGIGLSGLIGAKFVGEKIVPAAHLQLPILTDIPGVGGILFGEDAFVYFSVALIVGIWLFLYRTRAGLVLRAVGDNHTSAHALALVVFASWRPARLVIGAYLFGAVSILGLALQPLHLGIPQQVMNMLPYLATVVVLVLISKTRGTAGSAAPASLGLVFVPDR
jgi:ABC-type uncharacterized transport system permease subunit